MSRRKTLFPLSRKHKATIVNVVTRWAHTIAGTRAPNMDRVRAILDQVYADQTKSVRIKKITGSGANKKTSYDWKTIKLTAPTIVEVSSPIAFKIAQAVIRGRLSKTAARGVAKAFGIDPAFIDPLRRDKMLCLKRDHWYRGSGGMDKVWEDTLADSCRAAIHKIFYADKEPPRGVDGIDKKNQDRFNKLFKDMPALAGTDQEYNLTNNELTSLTARPSRRNWGSAEPPVQFGNFFCDAPTSADVRDLANVPWSSACRGACHSRMQLAEIASNYGTGYPDSEIYCDLLGVKDWRARWFYELMHEIPLCMTFQNTVLVCHARPVIKRNEAGELHCDTGPAVAWPDGCGQYFIDGHALGNFGRKIVEKPETITIDDIKAEENEEIKRIMIEKYGWGRYLDAIKAKVLDRRENWVDNTVEALVSTTTKIPRDTWQNGRWMRGNTDFVQRKLVLACRSTGRQYFLAVPETTQTCEEGQKWMAEGANCAFVRALKHPVRLVGAS